MHELSLATEIMRMTSEEVPLNGELVGIALTVGGLSCVSPESLVFCLESLAGPGIEVTVNRAPAVVECLNCGREYSPCDMYEACSCGSLMKRILSGRDITVDGIEIKEME